MTKLKEGYKETEIGVIPEEWEITKVGEVILYLKSGLSRKLSDYNIGIPCLRSSNIIDGKLDLLDLKYWYKDDPQGANIRDYILEEGDILVNFINSIAQIGKSCIFKNSAIDVIYTTNIFRIKVNPNKVDNEYFFYNTQTKSYNYQISLITKPAVNQASFTTGDFKNIVIPLPTLLEQQRIAEILSTTDEHIEKLDKTIEDYQLLKKGMMKKLLTEGIGHTEFKDTELGRIPKEWEVKTLKEITNKVIDNRGKTPPLSESGYKLIEALHLRVDTVIPLYFEDKQKYVSKDTYDTWFRNGHPNKNDILFTTVGNIAFTALVPNENICIAQNIIALQLKSIADSKFVLGVTKTSYFRKEVDKVVMNGVQPSIKVPHLLSIKLQFPNLEEQQEISDIISSIEYKINLLFKEREDFLQFKKALMEQLLTGKIRVNQ